MHITFAIEVSITGIALEMGSTTFDQKLDTMKEVSVTHAFTRNISIRNMRLKLGKN